MRCQKPSSRVTAALSYGTNVILYVLDWPANAMQSKVKIAPQTRCSCTVRIAISASQSLYQTKSTKTSLQATQRRTRPNSRDSSGAISCWPKCRAAKPREEEGRVGGRVGEGEGGGWRWWRGRLGGKGNVDKGMIGLWKVHTYQLGQWCFLRRDRAQSSGSWWVTATAAEHATHACSPPPRLHVPSSPRACSRPPACMFPTPPHACT